MVHAPPDTHTVEGLMPTWQAKEDSVVPPADSIESLITPSPIATGRACGSCSLCCKLLPIRELEKPENKWCVHCKPASGGCTIYADRPPSCREFACHWLISKNLGDEW